MANAEMKWTPGPEHDFAAGEIVVDGLGNRYIVSGTRWTGILAQTASDGPIAYHLGDGSQFRRVLA